MNPRTAMLAGLAALTLATPAVIRAAPIATWYGTYTWEENVGRHGGTRPGEGIVAFRTYTLRLGPGAGSTRCTLMGEGLQLYERTQCTATPELNRLVIRAYSVRGTGPYATGTRLVTLTRSGRGLVTKLGAIRPGSDRTPTAGRLFRYGRWASRAGEGERATRTRPAPPSFATFRRPSRTRSPSRASR